MLESDCHIDSVSVPNTGGRIGMSACPGRTTAFFGGTHQQLPLGRDLALMRTWGASGLVSLIDIEEIDILGLGGIEEEARLAGLWWRHLPIRDMCEPDSSFESSWETEGARLRRLLCAGERIVLHCWAGLGRTGTVAARLLVELGMDPESAIRQVREARSGAIQSVQQEMHVRACRRPVSRPTL